MIFRNSMRAFSMFMLETNLETRKLTVRYLKTLLKSVLQNWFKALPQLRSERLAL